MTLTPSAGTSPAAAPADAVARPRRKVWIDGQFVDQEDAKVSVFDHGLLYGDGCFEGIRSYSGRIFKLRSHLRRLYRSAEMIRLKPAYTIDEVDAAVRESLAVNHLRDAYIRLVFSRGVGTLGLNPFRCPVPGTIIIADSIQLYPPELYESGLKIIVAQRPRIPIACLDPSVKSLNYLNNVLAKIEALDAGLLEAIMLNINGYVSECTGDNIFIVKSGKLLTPPKEAGILHGITRDFVIEEVGPACGHKVQEKMMRLDEVLDADEVFLTGTAAEIIGVTRIDETKIGDGRVGAVTQELTEEFRRRVREGAPED